MKKTLPVPSITGRRQRKRQKMASHLATIAFELFEEQGYEDVTMEQIAAEADVAKATLYNYFPVKEALVEHRFRDEIVDGMAQLSGQLAAHKTFEARMRFLLRESATWYASKRLYLPHYIGYLNGNACRDQAKTGSDTAPRVSLRILTDMFRGAQESAEIKRAVTAERLAWSFQFLLYGVLSRWLIYTESDLTEEFLLAFDVFFNGVAVHPKRRSRTEVRSTASAAPRRRK